VLELVFELVGELGLGLVEGLVLELLGELEKLVLELGLLGD
jgi:hypothetical protein